MVVNEGYVLSEEWDRIPFLYNLVHKKKYNEIKKKVDNLEHIDSMKDALQYLNYNPRESKEKLEQKITDPNLLEQMQLTGSINSGYKLTESGRETYKNIYSGRTTPGEIAVNFYFSKILRIDK